MERMNKDQEKTLGEQVLGYIAELEEENKTLKEDNKRLREGVDAGQKLVEDLISKNKKLERDLAETQKIGESRRQECKKLRMGFSDFGYENE